MQERSEDQLPCSLGAQVVPNGCIAVGDMRLGQLLVIRELDREGLVGILGREGHQEVKSPG